MFGFLFYFNFVTLINLIQLATSPYLTQGTNVSILMKSNLLAVPTVSKCFVFTT